MERKIEFFTVREILESGLKGLCYMSAEKYKYQTIFYNSTEEMKNAKMFVGLWFNDKFYELKIVMKREKIEPNLEYSVTGDKDIIYHDFYYFIKDYYPILKIKQSHNKLYIIENSHDYEISFIFKRGVTR